MDNYSKIGLYNHNIVSYNKIKQGFLNNDIVSIVHATGTGKSYNALQLAYDNKDKKTVYIVSSNSIAEHLKEIIEENPNLDFARDFPNLEFRTYQSLTNLSDKELADLDIDLLILDEFHHIGAPIWGARINTIVETHKNIKVFGMTAYTVRDRGTIYERDMANNETNELFSGSVVSKYDLCDAMIDGVLPKPIYKSGYVYLEQTADALEQKLEKLNHNSKDYKELSALFKDIKKRLHEASSIKDIFKNNIKPNGKYIYFCPPGAENGKNDVESIMKEVENWVKEMELSEDEYEFYVSTGEMGEDGKKNRKAFYDDKDLNGNKIDNKLRIMFAINQYNEGVHAPGLDGVVMGRGTKSDIIFFEQLGRALSVRGRTKEEYDKLYSKSLEELVELCNKRQIKINDINSKEEIIEQLLAPTIIDLANNIGFIKYLENNLKERIKEIQARKLRTIRNIHLGNVSFDINMINEDLFKILEYINDRLTMTWEDKYNLAKAYYEHYKNLDIPHSFKTINGVDYDENGTALGKWISYQKQAYHGRGKSKITKEQIELLEKIGICFDVRDNNIEWLKRYNLVKIYFEHYKTLDIPLSFKTSNGIDYDENGIALGFWIPRQKQAYRGNNRLKITKEQVELLEKIGVCLDVRDNKAEWLHKYNLAKAYYKHYGNLNIPHRFKTNNGIDYDKDGIALGLWIHTQKVMYKTDRITKDRLKLLEEIGITFENVSEMAWQKKYALAKAYYEHYGNLNIPQNFKTINGIDYDENGIALGGWISTQRKYKMNSKLTEKQIKLLKEIGMIFQSINKMEWQKKYALAKTYYEHYKTLDIPLSFKTSNGIDYDKDGITLGNWIYSQRYSYYGKGHSKLTDEQIKLLEEIGMKWYLNDKYDDKIQNEIIADNKTSKQIEILNRVYSHLNKYDANSLPTKEEMNSNMLDELNHVRKGK